MTDFFLKLLINSAVAGCIVSILMVTARLWRRRVSAHVSYWIWFIIALRFVLPFSLPQSAMVVVPVNDPIMSASALRPHVAQSSAEEEFNTKDLTADTAYAITDIVQVQSDRNLVPAVTQITLIQLIICLWGMGMIAVLIWRTAAYIRFQRLLKRCLSPCCNTEILTRADELKAEMNIRPRIRVMMNCVQSTPFLTGFFRPVLVLPEGEFDDRHLTFMLCHELTHLKRGDLWYKLLMQIAAVINWFNPAVWLMLAMAVRDMELACDADVVRNLGIEDRRSYAFTLLKIAEDSLYVQTEFAANMNGNARIFKERIVEIMNVNKRRGGILAAAAVILSLMVFGGIFGFSMPEKSIEETVISDTVSETLVEIPAETPVETDEEELVEEKTVVEADQGVYTRTVDGKDYAVIENELIRIYLPSATEISSATEEVFMQCIDWAEEATGLDTLTNLTYHYRFYDNLYMTETEIEKWLEDMNGFSRKINALWNDNTNQKEDADIRLGFYGLSTPTEGRTLGADSTGIYIGSNCFQISPDSYDDKSVDVILRDLSYVAFLRSVDSLGGWFYNRPFAEGFAEWATVKAERENGLDELVKENLGQLELSSVDDIEDYFTVGWIQDNETSSPKLFQYGYVFLTYLEEAYGSDVFKEILKDLDSKEYTYPTNPDDNINIFLPYNSGIIVNTIKEHTSETVFDDCIEWFDKNKDTMYK